MSLYGGIDLHANNSVVVLLNDQDQVIYQKRLPEGFNQVVIEAHPGPPVVNGQFLVVECR